MREAGALVPMRDGVVVETPEDDGQGALANRAVLDGKMHEGLVVPEPQRTLCDLEVWALDAAGEAAEERQGDFFGLANLEVLEKLIELVEHQDLLGAAAVRPVSKQPDGNLRNVQR